MWTVIVLILLCVTGCYENLLYSVYHDQRQRCLLTHWRFGVQFGRGNVWMHDGLCRHQRRLQQRGACRRCWNRFHQPGGSLLWREIQSSAGCQRTAHVHHCLQYVSKYSIRKYIKDSYLSNRCHLPMFNRWRERFQHQLLYWLVRGSHRRSKFRLLP